MELDGLPAMQEAVGGYIELVPLNRDHFTMYCNEEGKVRNLRFNRLATRMADMHRDWEDPLVGDVLILGPIDGEGNDTDVPDEVIAMVDGLAASG
jgi:hypothetical protein